MRALVPSLCLGLGFLSAPVARAAGEPIPAAPYYYVHDDAQVLSLKAKSAIQNLLVQHDHVTGEQVVVAVFKTLGQEELVDFTNRVFSAWKIGRRGKDNGVLLAIYWKDHKARIEVGYGLESLLTDAKSKGIIEDVLIPELKNGNPDRAVTLASLEILRDIGSPLVQSGEASHILNAVGESHFTSTRWEDSHPAPGALWIVIFCVLALTSVIRAFSSADAHFTRDGRIKSSPWRRFSFGTGLGGSGWGGRSGGGWGWGGGGGGWGGGGGGGGGFIGGGGSSGGGGASGSW